jgi:hypothetical protein
MALTAARNVATSQNFSEVCQLYLALRAKGADCINCAIRAVLIQ